MRFTVRSGQGGIGGFNPGDQAVTGDLGTADLAGHVPDQGMVIYLSVVQLLASLVQFLRGNARLLNFTGADTTFGLVVRRANDGLSVVGKGGVVAWTAARALASVVLRAADGLGLGRALSPEEPITSEGKPPLPRSSSSYRARRGERRAPG
ncbi:hypothetical protein ACF073_29590 [Streptomyces sp. NPDC015171]|uniref:hypothetical protein n=1 Tax=Streptomyces sp. NPDC015171 TaxID=3364945 RepID=UPI0036F7A808